MDKDSRAIRTTHLTLPSANVDEAKSPLYSLIVAIVNLLNGGISLGTGESQTFAGNVVGLYVDVLTPSVAGNDFTINHSLGYIPQCALVVRADRSVNIYISSQATDTKTITLRASVAGATIKVWIF